MGLRWSVSLSKPKGIAARSERQCRRDSKIFIIASSEKHIYS